MSDVIVTEDLGFAYGDHVALHHVSVTIPAGRIGLVGANGAGKTTLIRILLGILRPTVGKTTVLDADPLHDPVAVRSRIGYMPELDCLPMAQTAADFMIYAAELAGIPPKAARQRASDVLTLVGLDEERFRPLGGFSTGMKQRAKLAQAIVHDPELVLLDEPTAGLDPEGRDEMLDLICRLGGFGINVVTSSHVLSDIERHLRLGGDARRREPCSARARSARCSTTDTVEIEVFEDPAPLLARLGAAGCVVEQDGHRLTVSAPQRRRQRADRRRRGRHRHGYPPHGIAGAEPRGRVPAPRRAAGSG